jgi:hypothetical protein
MSSMMTVDVWNSYPGGGAELLIALALADRADDEGTVTIDDLTYLMWRCRLPDSQFHSAFCGMLERGDLRCVNLDHDVYQLTFSR